jgi:cellulose 1,4-beta-cellobiosidase
MKWNRCWLGLSCSALLLACGDSGEKSDHQAVDAGGVSSGGGASDGGAGSGPTPSPDSGTGHAGAGGSGAGGSGAGGNGTGGSGTGGAGTGGNGTGGAGTGGAGTGGNGTGGAGTGGNGTGGNGTGGSTIADASPPGTGADGAAPDDAAIPPPASGNPYDGARMYVNPDWVAEIETSVVASPADAAQFRKVEAYSTAIWLDSIAKLVDLPRYLDDALGQQKALGQPVVTTFVIYDLPNRDCAANASNGELSVDANGEQRYQSEYIDKIAAIFAAHPSQRIVGIVEPDSLPNIATNLAIAKCAASQDAYRRGVAYAISKLSRSNVFLYVDAAHAGWLGWNDNRTKIAQIFKDVLTSAGGFDKVRGFATNSANYNILRGNDGQMLEPSNPCPDELTYVQKLSETLAAAGMTNKAFLVDTARNGRGGIRTKWGNWCNIRGAGLGERPRASPSPGIDAYYWIKPPGESDGISDPTAPRYDAMCSSSDSVTGAPQAGQWFSAYFADLVKNANPGL